MLNVILYIIMFNIFPCIASLAFAPSNAPLADPGTKNALIGIYICRLDGTEIYSKNKDQLFMPASNQKIYTTLYALSKLGPNHRPKTLFWKKPDALIIDAPGDPSLTDKEIEQVRKHLNLNGMLPVYVRQAYHPSFAPTWEYVDLSKAFAAPSTALSINGGKLKLYAANKKLEPISNAYQLKTDRNGNATTFGINYDILKGILHINGPLPSKKTLIATIPIKQPDRTVALMLGNAFHETTQIPSTPPSYILEGAPLYQTIRVCLEHSDNTHADHLLFMAAGTKGTLPPSSPYQLATQRMKDFFTKEVKIAPENIQFADGYGSRHNLATPKAIAQALLWSQKQPYAKLFRDSLAKPGIGILKNRLAGYNVSAKSGTLDTISGLSGFLQLSNGESVIFSILINNANLPRTKLRQIIDGLVEEYAKSLHTKTPVALNSKSSP